MTVSISTNFVLIDSTVPSLLLADSRVQWQKCEGEEKQENERKAERHLWMKGAEKIKKLLVNIKLSTVMDSILRQLLLCGRVQFVHGFAFNRIKLELCQQYKSIQSLNHQCCLAWTYRVVGPAMSYDILFVFYLTQSPLWAICQS